jgi:hypothetical protein
LIPNLSGAAVAADTTSMAAVRDGESNFQIQEEAQNGKKKLRRLLTQEKFYND